MGLVDLFGSLDWLSWFVCIRLLCFYYCVVFSCCLAWLLIALVVVVSFIEVFSWLISLFACGCKFGLRCLV